jgi:hypothetical protein
VKVIFNTIGRDDKKKLHINLTDKEVSKNEDVSLIGTVESLLLNRHPSKTTEYDSSNQYKNISST